LYKYKEEYKQGEMWHYAQRDEISEENGYIYIYIYIYIYVPAWALPGNGSVTTEISTATIDHGSYKRKGDSFISLFYLMV
jgi:hypothetical protein